MKAEFSVKSPLTNIEASEISSMFKDTDIELYCGIEQFIIINLGRRSFKYPKKNAKSSVISKINYMISHNI